MDTLKLFWFFLWRMALWGLGLGAGLGVAYGIVAVTLGFAIVGIIGEGASESGLLGTLADERASEGEFLKRVAGLLLGLVLMVPLGIVLGILGGLFLGVPAGAALGVICGLVLFALTYYYFIETESTITYRQAARVAGAIVTVVGLITVWAILGFEPDAFAGGGPVGTIDGGVADVFLWEIGPMIVAGWAAQFASKRVADQYAKKHEATED